MQIISAARSSAAGGATGNSIGWERLAGVGGVTFAVLVAASNIAVPNPPAWDASGVEVAKMCMRRAITPVVTAAGLDIGILLGGAILTETVFNIPGVGRLAFDSIQNSDLPMIQGTVLIGAFFIVLMNLVVDIAYAFIDPRVRYS